MAWFRIRREFRSLLNTACLDCNFFEAHMRKLSTFHSLQKAVASLCARFRLLVRVCHSLAAQLSLDFFVISSVLFEFGRKGYENRLTRER